jgi:diguanylate cyclase (GGDEF)-like protein/PAS domain S-box-containing protein
MNGMMADTLDRLLPASSAVDFELVLEQAEIGICISQDGLFRYVNDALARMHRSSPAELVGTPFVEAVHPDSRALMLETLRKRDAGRQEVPYEARCLRKDGSTFHARIFGRTIVFRGRPAYLTTVSDVTELSDALRVSSWRARMLRSNELLCSSGSIEILPAERAVRLSAGARHLLQLDSAAREIGLRAALHQVPREDRTRVLAQWRKAQPGKPFDFLHNMVRADGSFLRLLHRGLIEIEADGSHRPVAILQDITEQAEAQAQIEQLTNYDPVTGLCNRTLLMRHAQFAVETAQREKRPLAMLYLRVPDFDRVHDALGLAAGDALASTLAGRLVGNCRPEDTCAHLGGGEFAILLDPMAGADESQALGVATRIMAALEIPTTVETTELITGGHIGIALLPADAESAEELLQHAFVACGRGGAGISFYTRAAAEQAAYRIRLEAALRRAFEREELSLNYQPQVDLRNGSVVGAEALLRWTSEEFGVVSPAEFVPVAEDMGLIVPIGEWVFRMACLHSVAWARAGLPVVRIGVNLSPRQLALPDISQRLQTILLETGADPTHMGIEITESTLMHDLDHARRMLEELSAIGIEISLDDFGTGYSNMHVLRALPFDVLKIDRSLVHDVTAAPEDVSITRAVLMLAQGLKIKVLAEGVETEGQLNLLISNGCEMMQGYIFSRPLTVTQMEALLLEGRRLPEQYLARSTQRRTLLLVDDEENVLSSLRRLLRGAGYQIVLARNGAEGLAKLAEHDVDVIVSDQRMPGMTGVEFLRRAKELYPDTVRMVLSGYTELQTITDAVNEGAIYKFLTKPWDDALLRDHIAEAFRRKELSDENRRLAAEVRSANHELAQANERQEELLLRQRERLGLEERRALNAQDLLENLPTALIGLDDEGMVAFVNRQARELMGTAHLLVGCEAEQVLPAEWAAAWREADGRHHRSRVGERDCFVSCAPMNDLDPARGRLITVIPLRGTDRIPQDQTQEDTP